jgi:hypothetical protein
MDKETETSKSTSRRSHDEKIREEISVGKHSFRKTRSTLYPIKKNKRSIRVGEL